VNDLPPEVMTPLNHLAGQFLWLINGLTVVAFIGLGAHIAMRHVLGQEHSVGGWLVKIVIGLALAAAATDIASVVISG
jgi:hypothetical protein